MPGFSICLIARNEAETLPNLMASLQHARERGVEIVLVDTGSTDGTADLARSYGCRVVEVGARFLIEIDDATAEILNREFVVGFEEPIVQPGRKVFSFSKARNFAASVARHDLIVMPDCDEVYTALDLGWLEEQANAGVTHIYNEYVWARDAQGRPVHRFMRDRIYDRRAGQWVGITHENLRGANLRRCDAPADKIAQDHRPPARPHKADDLPSLALDTHESPDDRRLHYFARELMFRDRPKSAIAQLARHLNAGSWLAERAQSLIYMGDCFGKLNEAEQQADCYQKAFHLDPTRRTALLRLAYWHKQRDHYAATAAFAAAALEVPRQEFYADDEAMYRDEPHALLYWAKGWQGDVAAAREHLLTCLGWKPLDPTYLAHTKFYFEYPDNGIDGWMSFPELQWLYETAKQFLTIAEIGSWKGRSTHALLSGSRGTVIAIDHWRGSTCGEGEQSVDAGQAVFANFQRNVGRFPNLRVVRKPSLEAAADFPDGSLEMVFIDGAHDYESARADILAWLPKTSGGGLICGHDYGVYPGVTQAVDELFGKPHISVCGSIWSHYIGR